MSDKTYSKTDFEPAIRGSVRRASGLVLVGKQEVTRDGHSERSEKDADPDIPILKEAKAEYAKLQ